MTFGEILRKLRMKKGLTQAELADLLGMSRSTIGMYEQGKREPDFEVEGKIASLFDVSLDYLRTGKEVVQMIVDRGHAELDGAEYFIEVHADPDNYSDANLEKWNEFERKRWLSPIDRELLVQYHAATPGTQASVRKLLDIPDTVDVTDEGDDLPIAAHGHEGATVEEQMEDVEIVKDDKV